MFYTVGVSRFLKLGFRKFKVIGHTTSGEGGVTRLLLDLADGGFLAVPKLDRRTVKVYSDYRAFQAQRQALQQQAAPQPVQKSIVKEPDPAPEG